MPFPLELNVYPIESLRTSKAHLLQGLHVRLWPAPLFGDVLRSQEGTRTTSPACTGPVTRVIGITSPSRRPRQERQERPGALPTPSHAPDNPSSLPLLIFSAVSPANVSLSVRQWSVPRCSPSSRERWAGSSPPRCHSHTYANALAYQK